MKHIVLGDSLKIGHPELDAEHEKLVTLVNECVDISTTGGGSNAVEGKMVELRDFLRFHVQHEENIMAQLSYDLTEEEKYYHCKGLNELSSLQRQLSQGRAVLDVVQDIKSLILVTFLKTDMGLKSYLPEIRKG